MNYFKSSPTTNLPIKITDNDRISKRILKYGEEKAWAKLRYGFATL